MKLKETLELLEKHGLINKVIDKLLTPENLRAIAEGIAAGAAKEMKNDRLN